MTDLIKIFNPLTDYKVEVFINAAQIKYPKDLAQNQYLSAFGFLQNFEQLSLLPLKKEMFVCEVEKPDNLESNKWLSDFNAWEYHQSQLLFEGFEKDHVDPDNFLKCGDILIDSKIFLVWREQDRLFRLPANPTIGDFITEISRYNRTATQKIEIKVTENWVKMIVG